MVGAMVPCMGSDFVIRVLISLESGCSVSEIGFPRKVSIPDGSCSVSEIGFPNRDITLGSVSRFESGFRTMVQARHYVRVQLLIFKKNRTLKKFLLC